MGTENKELHPLESFQLIESMIQTARNRLSENGHLYLLWGWVVFACSLAQYTLQWILLYEKHYLVWMVTWVAFVYQVIYIYRERRKQRVKSYADEMVSAVWIAFVVTMFICGFTLGSRTAQEQQQYYSLIGPIFLALYGVPTFVSGRILRFRPLRIGGICCWLLALLSSYAPAQYQLLLLAAAVAIAWIVPGYLLRSKFRKSNP